jgi:hypothetical protein
MEALGSEPFAALLQAFEGCTPLRGRLLHVLRAIPVQVQQDFLDDPRFRISLETHVPGVGWTVLMNCPGPVGSDSRCVVLRAKLATCSAAFAHYVIAHELAHAYLRNGGWGEITDHEVAADTLASNWGFPRPLDRPAR